MQVHRAATRLSISQRESFRKELRGALSSSSKRWRRAELQPEDDDVIFKAVQSMYMLDRPNRRLANFFLPKHLDRYLVKWVGKGIYNAVFDNVEDSLSLSRLQSGCSAASTR